VRDGQPSPHRPRLVVSRSTCPPISPPPHVNSFVLGPAVINTHRQDPGENGRRIENFIGENEHLSQIIGGRPVYCQNLINGGRRGKVTSRYQINSLFLSLSIFLCLSPSLPPSLSLLSHSHSLSPSLPRSLSPSLPLSLSPSLSLSPPLSPSPPPVLTQGDAEAQEPAARTARSRLQLALHAQRDPLRDETRSGQGALARRHTDGPLWAALLKTTVMCEAWRPRTTAPPDPSRTSATSGDFGQS
jgi:hypothetical protein